MAAYSFCVNQLGPKNITNIEYVRNVLAMVVKEKESLPRCLIRMENRINAAGEIWDAAPGRPP